jgi:hypothetical protein
VVLALSYPVVGNVLLYTGVLENIISHKPEKLKIQWASAWTLLPGRINVEGFKLDIHSRRSRIQLDLDEAVIDLSLRALIERKVDIRYADIRGFEFSLAKRPKQSESGATESKPAQRSPAKPGAASSTVAEVTAGRSKKRKPPWVIQLKNVSAFEVRSIQINKLHITGNGTLQDYAMRLVTKGGPLRIGGLNLDMKVDVPTDPAGKDAKKHARLRTALRLAENVPKRNKGKKLLKFVSGRLEVRGDASSLKILSALLGNNYKLNMSGKGKLDLLALIEAGELQHGSRIDFNSDQFETDFLSFHASGGGEIVGSVNKDNKQSVSLKINVRDFKLQRSGVPKPYMEGADLFVELSGAQFFLHQGVEDGQLFVNFPQATVRDLTDYNRFIPEHANVRILSGTGTLRGTMSVFGDIGNVSLDLTGADVLLDVHGNKISTDLLLVTNLADGSYGKKSYNLSGTYFRLEDTQLVAEKETTKSGWWGEIEITKGDLIWTQPIDIDAVMRIKLRDSEPLIALVRDTNKRKSLLDRALTVKDVEGTLGIQTNEDNILLDPILIKGKGLEVISKLDVLSDSINGALYVKLRGVPVNFEIKHSKAKFKGLGGKKKVKKMLNRKSPGSDAQALD